jgi:hypothetical protein
MVRPWAARLAPRAPRAAAAAISAAAVAAGGRQRGEEVEAARERGALGRQHGLRVRHEPARLGVREQGAPGRAARRAQRGRGADDREAAAGARDGDVEAPRVVDKAQRAARVAPVLGSGGAWGWRAVNGGVGRGVR